MNDPNERTTKTSLSSVDEEIRKFEEEELPKEYQPEILRAVENAPVLGHITMYGVGLEMGEDSEFGMTHGPFSNLSMALEIVPGDDEEQKPPRFFASQSRIIRFNKDHTSDTLYSWLRDRWVLREGATLKDHRVLREGAS